MSTPESFNLDGRWAFLDAIEKHWRPSPLGALQEIAPTIEQWLGLREFFNTPAGLVILNNHSWPWRWKELKRDESNRDVIILLEQWRSRYPLHASDTWVMDAALHSIVGMTFRNFSEWIYNPPVETRQRFQPDLPFSRLRQGQDPRVFKKWYHRVLEEKLDNYLREIDLYHKGASSAEWTARAWAGETAQNIRDSLNPRAAATQTVTSIQKAIQRFAKSVGLTRPGSGCGAS